MIERTRNAYSLALAAGETYTPVADQRFHAVALRADHRIEASKLNSTLYRSHIDFAVGNSESHVTHNRIVPQVNTLWDVPDSLAPNGKVLPNVLTVHLDAAVKLREEAKNKIDKRSLPRAGLSNQPYILSPGDRQI